MIKNVMRSAIAALAILPAPLMAQPGVPIHSETGKPMRLLGFTVFGSAEAIGKLEQDLAPLAGLGVKTGRPKTEDGRIELMILFLEGVGPITVEVVKQKIVAGAFQSEYITMPDSLAK